MLTDKSHRKEDSLRSTLIPGQDVAIGVENENGVVSYGLDEDGKIGILAGRFRRTGGFGLGSLTDENRR